MKSKKMSRLLMSMLVAGGVVSFGTTAYAETLNAFSTTPATPTIPTITQGPISYVVTDSTTAVVGTFVYDSSTGLWSGPDASWVQTSTGTFVKNAGLSTQQTVQFPPPVSETIAATGSATTTDVAGNFHSPTVVAGSVLGTGAHITGTTLFTATAPGTMPIGATPDPLTNGYVYLNAADITKNVAPPPTPVLNANSLGSLTDTTVYTPSVGTVTVNSLVPSFTTGSYQVAFDGTNPTGTVAGNTVSMDSSGISFNALTGSNATMDPLTGKINTGTITSTPTTSVGPSGISTTGTIQGGTLTDGTATLTGGKLSNGTSYVDLSNPNQLVLHGGTTSTTATLDNSGMHVVDTTNGQTFNVSNTGVATIGGDGSAGNTQAGTLYVTNGAGSNTITANGATGTVTANALTDGTATLQGGILSSNAYPANNSLNMAVWNTVDSVYTDVQLQAQDNVIISADSNSGGVGAVILQKGGTTLMTVDDNSNGGTVISTNATVNGDLTANSGYSHLGVTAAGGAQLGSNDGAGNQAGLDANAAGTQVTVGAKAGAILNGLDANSATGIVQVGIMDTTPGSQAKSGVKVDSTGAYLATLDSSGAGGVVHTTTSDVTISVPGGNSLTVNSSGTTVTGPLTANNGASVTGGINNNGGGITNAGAVSGVTTLTATTGNITTVNSSTVNVGQMQLSNNTITAPDDLIINADAGPGGYGGYGSVIIQKADNNLMTVSDNGNGGTQIYTTLGVTGATTLSSTLTVAGAATLNGATQVNNSLNVDTNGATANVAGTSVLSVATGATTLGVTNAGGHVNGVSANATSATMTGGTSSTTLTLDDAGAHYSGTSGGPVTVTGVANGVNAYDAVNVGQLQSTRTVLSRGIASVTAMANIPSVDQNKTFAVGVGLGSYDSQTAVAIGASYRMTPDTVLRGSVGTASSSGKAAYGIGLASSW